VELSLIHPLYSESGGGRLGTTDRGPRCGCRAAEQKWHSLLLLIPNLRFANHSQSAGSSCRGGFCKKQSWSWAGPACCLPFPQNLRVRRSFRTVTVKKREGQARRRSCSSQPSRHLFQPCSTPERFERTSVHCTEYILSSIVLITSYFMLSMTSYVKFLLQSMQPS